MSSKEPGICTCFLSWPFLKQQLKSLKSIRILEINPMQSRATITSKKNGRFISFPSRSLFYKLILDEHTEARRAYEKDLQSPRALTNGVCHNTAHVQVMTVAYCSFFFYIPIFHIHLCYSPRKMHVAD